MNIIRALMIMLLLCLVTINPLAQDSQVASDAKGSVTGKVTLNGKPASGMIVMLKKHITGPRNDDDTSQKETILKATTDSEGRYRFDDVETGRYSVFAYAPSFATSAQKPNHASINVTEGQTVEVNEIALARGGVITGRVVDPEGRPVIQGGISIAPVDEPTTKLEWHSNSGHSILTDDRGVYRAYGLAPGRYVVSVHKGEALFDMRGSSETYHPGVADQERAKVVEVTQGGETGGIDIKLVPAEKGFAATGRVVEEDTGNPVANALVGITRKRMDNEDSTSNSPPTVSSAKGEFRIENLQPGSYEAAAVTIKPGNEYYVDPITFEVRNGDVAGLEIRLKRGATINGFVVVEGATSPDIGAKLSQTAMTAQVKGPDGIDSSDEMMMGLGAGRVAADGTFRITGLRPGRAVIRASNTGYDSPGLKVARVEHNGVDAREGIEVSAGQIVTGVRVVMMLASGTIHGKINLPGGRLEESSYLNVRVYESGSSEQIAGAQRKEDGSFVVGNLIPGTYDIEAVVIAHGPGQKEIGSSGRQTVTVTADMAAEVTLSVTMKPKDR